MSDQMQLSRRVLLRGFAGGALAMGAMGLLAACGDDDDDEADPTATQDNSAASDPTPTEADSAATEEDAGEEDPTPTEEDDPTPTVGGEPTPAPSVGGSLVIYSGRSEELVGPIIERFREDTGIDVQVQYAGTAELAATILEEGENTLADVFFAQDAGALGAVRKEGFFAELPQELLDRVEPRFRSPDGQWIGISGRARVLVYSRELVTEEELPESILDLTDPAWDGRLGWAPTNGSFQSFVTALRVIEGEDGAREWLEGMIANNPAEFPNNSSQVEAAINGEIAVGLVNHYYLYRFEEEAGGEVGAANYWMTGGDPGALINVAGIGMLSTSQNPDAAELLIDYFLSEEGQRYFAEETFEYPLLSGIEADPRLVPLEEIQTPDIDLSDLDDLEGTLQLLTEVGLL